jgi:PhoPQ-activated pathogenicity-related protein
MKLAEKSNVFHQRHVGKSADVQEDSSPAEYAVIAASHSQQKACVMRKAVRESINQPLRQANPEVAANDIRVIHYAPDLIQTSQWQFNIDVYEPKDVAVRSAGTGIHLYGSIGLASNKLTAKARGEIDRAI